MSIQYNYHHNSGLTKNLLSKYLDHGFIETFKHEAKLLGKADKDFNMVTVEEKCKDLSDQTLNFALALDGKELAGILAVRSDDPREIQMLWVEEKYRKRGVGRRLVEVFHNSCGKLPMKVEVLKGNTVGIQFYQELGFEFIDKARFQTNLVGYTKVKL